MKINEIVRMFRHERYIGYNLLNKYIFLNNPHLFLMFSMFLVQKVEYI